MIEAELPADRLLALWLLLSAAAILRRRTEAKPSRAESAKAMSGSFRNEDSTNFFFYHDIRPGEAGQTIDRYVDVPAWSAAA